jgi:hypothetical protein
MISLQQCAKSARLSSNELMLGVSPTRRHRRLLTSYLLNIERGAVNVREMIVADLHAFLDLGLPERAADALVVLRLFLKDYPEARSDAGTSLVDEAGSVVSLSAFKNRARRPGRQKATVL